MKKSLSIILFAAFFTGLYSFVPGTKQVAQTAYTVDITKSKIDWNGSGGDHYHLGSFGLKGGQVIVDNGKITGGKFTIDLSSVKADAGERLEGHLKSDAFFDVAKSSEAVYEIKSVKYTSDNTADIDGSLTMKGATVDVKFTAKIRGVDDKKLFAEASFSIDRTLWGVSYGPGKVANDVAITVHLFGAK